MNHDYEKGRKAGYEQGWAACMDALGSRRRKALLKYTDAPEVVYRPGSITGTELQMADMERVKRRDVACVGYVAGAGVRRSTENWPGRHPCPMEHECPVQPGCHICGWTKEELAAGLDKKRGTKK